MHARSIIYHEDGERKVDDNSILIDEDEYEVSSHDYGEATYDMDGTQNGVHIDTSACYVGSCNSGQAGTWTAWYDDLSIVSGTCTC